MRKEVIFILLFMLLVLPFVYAENETSTENPLGEQAKVNDAYKCLDERLGDDCSTSLEENVFSLLAIGKCKEEIMADSWSSNECWPKSNCKIKSTAQAILALDSVGASTLEAENWLLSKNITPENIVWYLEIESPKETRCTVSYGGSSYQVTIGEDKKISSSAGSCLSLSSGDWWLRISPSCYDREFEVSCDEQFLTTLLFKKKTSSTIHVSEEVSSASAEGTTSAKVNFKCFSETSTCNYDGSLWATLVLDHLGYDKTPYMPYLITMAEDNQELLPEAFLYLLTGSSDFRAEVLLKQKSQYWDESGDKFYDTALALLPFQYEEPAEKGNSKTWLLEIQGKDGCWGGGNIRNTAFILYSIWPENSYFSPTGVSDCEDAGYYCMSETNCQGSTLENYNCAGVFKCCDTAAPLESCSKQGGDVCNSDEVCLGGTTTEASGLDYGESCCVGGRCEESIAGTGLDCEYYDGTCRPYACEDNEEEDTSYNCAYGDTCCIEKSSGGITGGSWWIWALIILIIILVLMIIFRKRVKEFFEKRKSKKSKLGSPRGPPRLGLPMRRIAPRRIIPSSERHPSRQPQKSSSEIDDVLKKLKEMGK